MTWDTAARANETEADQRKPEGIGLWNLLWDQNGDDSTGKERRGWNKESQSPLNLVPNSAEKHTPLISAVCTQGSLTQPDFLLQYRSQSLSEFNYPRHTLFHEDLSDK